MHIYRLRFKPFDWNYTLKLRMINIFRGIFGQGFWVPLSIFFFLAPFPFFGFPCGIRVWQRRWPTSFANSKIAQSNQRTLIILRVHEKFFKCSA